MDLGWGQHEVEGASIGCRLLAILRTWNWKHGLVLDQPSQGNLAGALVVAPADVDSTLAHLKAAGETPWIIGGVESGSRGVVIEE